MSVSRPLLCTGCILSCCKTVLTDLAEPRARDYNVGKVEESVDILQHNISALQIFLVWSYLFENKVTYEK